MKKVLSLLLTVAMLACLVAGCATEAPSAAAPATAAEPATPAAPAVASEPEAPASQELDWPKSTIYVTSTHSVGGDTDYNARLLSKYLEEKLGVSVVVSNITGGNGSIAMTEFQSFDPDGYHFLMTNTVALSANEVSGLTDFGYDAFEPVAIFGRESGDTLIADSDMPFNTVDEMIAYTKENPSKIKVGIASGGGTYAAACMLQAAGAEIIGIDMSDGAERLAGVLGDHVDVAFCPFVLCKDYLETGEVKALCTLMSERSLGMPDTPTAVECGIEDLQLDARDVCLAVKGTDPAIVEAMNAAILDIVNNNAEFRAETQEYNYQEPWALNVSDTVDKLKAQRDHFMQFEDLIKG